MGWVGPWAHPTPPHPAKICYPISVHLVLRFNSDVGVTIHGYLRKTCWATPFLDLAFLTVLIRKLFRIADIISYWPEVTTTLFGLNQNPVLPTLKLTKKKFSG